MTTSQLFFRLDDIGRADRTTFQVIECLESLDHPYILAVIPDALGWRMKRFLRTKYNAVVFQHGVNHKNKAGPNLPDEFPSECGRNQIEAAIRRGRRSIQRALEREVFGYVPPWNRVSEVALRVLEDEGFRVLSADSISTTTLYQLPVSVDVYSGYRPITVRSNLEIGADIARCLQTSPLAGVMLHPLSIPKSNVPQLLELIVSNRGRTMTSSGWRELLSTYDRSRTALGQSAL